MARDEWKWKDVKDMMGEREVALGSYLSYWFDRSPRRALHYASYYKFASKLIGKGKKVLDVGCSEGLGTWMLAVECGFACGVDCDDEAIGVALGNWRDPRIEFVCEDFLRLPPRSWDAVVGFDVIEHIYPDHVGPFLGRVAQNLKHDGIAILGTPSLGAAVYASEVSRAGHVNLYDHERLEAEVGRFFDHVFVFGANDEVVHTGFPALAHYLIALGCKKKKSA